jgi:glycerol-3-phosphate dehydrogenase
MPLQDHDDMITTADLKHALSRLGYSSVDEDTIGHILQEVDFDRKGSINFEDFIEIAAGLKGSSPLRVGV